MALSIGKEAATTPTPITSGRRKTKLEQQVEAEDQRPQTTVSDEEWLTNVDEVDLEIPMTTEQMNELRARNARMGLGGTNTTEPGVTFVTDYNAKGEAIDVEVPRQQPPEPQVIHSQYVMPMFEALRMDKLILNVAGRVELNYATKGDQALWDSLRPGETVEFIVTALVPSRGPKISFDSEREIKGKAGVAAAKVVEVRGLEPGPERIVYPGNPLEMETQALIQRAHDLLAGDYRTDDTLDLLRALAQLGEPSAPSNDQPEPEATALDDALAAALEGDEE